jgi:transmembrane sensor
MNSMLQRQIEENPIFRQAGEYFLDLQATDVSVERIAEWQLWMAAKSEHRDAFEQIEYAWSKLGEVNSVCRPLPRAQEKDDYDGSVSVGEWNNLARGGKPLFRPVDMPNLKRLKENYQRHRRIMIGSVLAACSLAAVTIFAFLGFFQSPSSTTTVVETMAGQNRALTLSDGSTLNVSGQSLLWVTLTSHSRNVTLERGEAFFHVAKDATRPFTVYSGTAAVTAVGTAFNVRRVADRTVIGVAEGIVKVESAEPRNAPNSLPSATIHLARLIAGQQVSIEREGTVRTVHDVDTQTIAGWREGRLWYTDEPLGSVVSDLNRYTSRDIEIADPAVRQLRVTAALLESDVDSWLESLEASFPIRIVHGSDGEVRLEKKR